MAPKFNAHNHCFWCVKTVKWIPVLFIVTIVVWSYYAYVIQLCLFTVDNIAEKVVYLIVFHGFFAMFAWSYWQTIFTEIGSVPRQFQLSATDLEKFEKEENEENQRRILERVARDLPVACRGVSGGMRYCEKCCHIKPDRAHHCSACGECILKMDHHCPWVNNCVAFTNYKFFVQFLGYSLLYCLYIAATALQYFIKFWKNELTEAGRFHILFLFFMAIMFAISLVSLFGYHLYLVSVNRTTLESFRAPVFSGGPDKDGFHLGKYQNFIQVFGERKKLWFLPIFSSSGNGVEYPTRTPQANSYNSMGSTQTSMGEGASFPQKHIDEDGNGLLNSRQRWEEDSSDVEGQVLPEQRMTNANHSSPMVYHEEVISRGYDNNPV